MQEQKGTFTEIYNKAIEEELHLLSTWVVKKVEINSEHNIDYYDEKIAF